MPHRPLSLIATALAALAVPAAAPAASAPTTLAQSPEDKALLKRFGLVLKAGATLAQLYFLPVDKNPLPADVRMEPTW